MVSTSVCIEICNWLLQFQSLIGILVGFDARGGKREGAGRPQGFQSLIGILVGFDACFCSKVQPHSQFQSLIGILVGFDATPLALREVGS